MYLGAYDSISYANYLANAIFGTKQNRTIEGERFHAQFSAWAEQINATTTAIKEEAADLNARAKSTRTRLYSPDLWVNYIVYMYVCICETYIYLIVCG